MPGKTRLYGLLSNMLHAAEDHRRDQVISINKEFSTEYGKVMPSNYGRDSLPNLYDRARNKILGSIDNIVSPTPEDRTKSLEKAREIISKIPKPKH